MILDKIKVPRKVPCPTGLEPYPYQVEGAWFLALTQRALLADEMGLGKTIQALLALNIGRPRRVLVLCPAFLVLNWKDEASKWVTYTPELIDFMSLDSYWRESRKVFRKQKWDVTIIDECHMLKESTAKRTKSVYLNRRKLGAIWCLTGTPILSRPIELYPITRLLEAAGLPKTRMEYGIRYCFRKIAGQIDFEFKGASNLEELGDKLRNSIMLRRLKSDELKDLPPKVRQMIKITPTKEAVLLINALHDEVYQSGPDILQETMSTEIKELGLLKAPHIVEHVKSVMAVETHHVVFVWNTEVVDYLMEELASLNPRAITGKVPMKKRHAIVEEFQNSDSGLVIANIQAGGVGLTMTRARTVTFGQTDWVPSKLTQAEDRVHRIGQSGFVTCYYLIYDGTHDVTMMQSVIKKQKNINKVLTPSGL